MFFFAWGLSPSRHQQGNARYGQESDTDRQRNNSSEYETVRSATVHNKVLSKELEPSDR